MVRLYFKKITLTAVRNTNKTHSGTLKKKILLDVQYLATIWHLGTFRFAEIMHYFHRA